MCSHPCTNTRKKILLIDTNVLIYSKQVILKDEKGKLAIFEFWEEICKEYCCLCEEQQFNDEFWNWENDVEVREFFNELIRKGLFVLQPYNFFITLEEEWKLVIDELKKLKNNDEKGLARLVKLCKNLIDSGCDKNIFEFLTYDKRGGKIIYHKLGLQISNSLSHKLWSITGFPQNWPKIYSEIVKPKKENLK
jgi:hypothetical protein